MDEAIINILDDPMAVSLALRNQYDNVHEKNQKQREMERAVAELQDNSLV